MENSLLEAASFRDPSGFVFRHNGEIYRQVNLQYKENYDLLMDTGLYERLADEGLLIAHAEVAHPCPASGNVYKVLKPQFIPFISYPYEWSFGQLKAAALLTLQVQQIALTFGMSLKDASAYNIQFLEGQPVFIDTLSFEKLDAGKPWVAYGQFCRHFLAPLALIHYKDIRLGQLLKIHLDGIPLDLASTLLPWQSWFRFSVLSHIHLHAKSQQKYARQTTAARNLQVKPEAIKHLVAHLETAVKGLGYNPQGTEWADYYTDTNYTTSGFTHKKRLIRLLTKQVNPQVVWDLGANTGEFSQLAAEKAGLVIAFDSDPAAVEKHYRENRLPNVLPLLLDLTNPSPALGWENTERAGLQERGPADMVLALALIHHLAISNNLPLSRIAGFFRKVCRTLLIEFVPKSDSQVQRLLASRPDIFPDYNQAAFEAIFGTVFIIEAVYPISESERVLYLMRAK